LSAPRPFTFAGLPRLTRQQVALHQSVLTHLSAQPASPTFAQDLAAVLTREMRLPAALTDLAISTVSRAALLPLLPEVGYFVIIGLGPGPHKLVLDIDPSLASWCVERLLGGANDKPQAARVARAPTDMETGVLSYLLLQVLAFFATGLSTGRELALILDRVVGTADSLEEFLGTDENYVNVGTRIQLGRALGSARLLIPESLVTEHFGAPVPDSHPSTFELAAMRKRLEALPEQHLLGHVVGAHLDLTPEDVAHLEAGDIIVLESHALSLRAEGVTGDVSVVMGSGKHCRLDGRLYLEDGASRLEVTGIHEQNERPGGTMAEDTHSDNLPETEGLLREMDAQVAVELGRIRLNTAQVVRLKAGQVLNLARGATDPVDLVIGGKLFAKGELIEVDGELGVRLTQLTGSH
jgi:flagellar motor switch/type III secretory pathway protein FliN